MQTTNYLCNLEWPNVLPFVSKMWWSTLRSVWVSTRLQGLLLDEYIDSTLICLPWTQIHNNKVNANNIKHMLEIHFRQTHQRLTEGLLTVHGRQGLQMRQHVREHFCLHRASKKKKQYTYSNIFKLIPISQNSIHKENKSNTSAVSASGDSDKSSSSELDVVLSSSPVLLLLFPSPPINQSNFRILCSNCI